MSKKFQAVRGMNDVLPEDLPLWHFVETCLKQTAASYGYQEIRFPALESTHLFKRTVGDVTDIVEKEMYTFADKNGDLVSLRPEGTAGCVRAGIEHGIFHNQTQKLWYLGPMYRHEKPQKGRYREFYQFGLEAIGYSGTSIEVEFILLMSRLWKRLGIAEEVRLELNTIGLVQERVAFKEALVAYLEPKKDLLDDDSRRRLQSNPMRILDSKVASTQALLKDAPTLTEFFGAESQAEFKALQDVLRAHDIAFVHNPKLVRGLDYYNHTVFEWVTDSLGAQGTVCAGGRYDGLVGLLGGKDTPAFGCALGLERLVLMLRAKQEGEPLLAKTDLFAVVIGEEAEQYYLNLAESLRDQFPKLVMNYAHKVDASFKNQFKRADKSGARFALIVAEEEVVNKTVTIKPLRERAEQITMLQSELVSYLQGLGF